MIRVYFFKQKTAYEMRISDWSSDVCSADLDAKLKLDDLKADLDALKADEKAQQKKVEGLTGAVSDSIAAQYEGQSISTTGKLVLSQDPDAFLEDLTTLSAYNDVQSQKLDTSTREVRAPELRREAPQERAKELASPHNTPPEEKDPADPPPDTPTHPPPTQP